MLLVKGRFKGNLAKLLEVDRQFSTECNRNNRTILTFALSLWLQCNNS